MDGISNALMYYWLLYHPMIIIGFGRIFIGIQINNQGPTSHLGFRSLCLLT